MVTLRQFVERLQQFDQDCELEILSEFGVLTWGSDDTDGLFYGDNAKPTPTLVTIELDAEK